MYFAYIVICSHLLLLHRMNCKLLLLHLPTFCDFDIYCKLKGRTNLLIDTRLSQLNFSTSDLREDKLVELKHFLSTKIV
uniref:Uncharacterized protein n=1 Tax=Oryza brachyantha TaxID=4533 RepID=J3KTY8_ORYBR